MQENTNTPCGHKELKDIIRSRRRELGMTLEEVGNKVGVTKGTVHRWETGVITNLGQDKIAALAAALQVSPEYLLGWTENPEITFNSNLAAAIAGLDQDEIQLVLNYIAFLKTQRNGRKK